MKFEHLKNFLVLSEHMSFTKAAEYLFIVQSTLSRQISSLEEEIGAKLLIRDTNSLKLTDAGSLLVAEGKKLLRQIDQIEFRVRKVAEDNTPSLTLVSLPLTFSYLSRLYSNFHKIHPDIKFSLINRKLGEISSLVESGRADIGLTYSLELEDKPDIYVQFKTRVLGHDHMCVLTKKDHVFTLSGRCLVEQLRKEKILNFNHSGLKYVKRRTLNSKLPPVDDSVNISETLETMLLLINSGAGVALLPAEEAKKYRPDMAIVEIDDYTVQFDILLIWKDDNENPVLHLFLNSLENLIQ